MTQKIEKEKILKIYFLFTIAIYLCFYIARFFGYLEKYWLFYFEGDLFGDFSNLIFSFSHIFSETDLLSLNVPSNKSPIVNPYSTLLENGSTPNMGFPPLTILLMILSANITKFLGSNYLVVYYLFLVIFIFFLFNYFISNLKSEPLLIFILFSFPMLFLVERGNIWAAISGTLIALLFTNFVKKSQLQYIDLVYFIIACSIRPNYIIFGLLFLKVKNYKYLILNFIKVASAISIFNLFVLLFATKVFPGYNFGYFLYLVDRYANSNYRFSSWNSSTHGFIYNIYSSFISSNFINISKKLSLRLEELIVGQAVNKFIIIFYLIILIYSFIKLFFNRVNKISFVSISCGITAAATSPFQDYHLIIFIFLFILIYQNFTNNKNIISLILISIILLPKFHLIPPSLNIHNIVNFICINLLIFINLKSFSKTKQSN